MAWPRPLEWASALLSGPPPPHSAWAAALLLLPASLLLWSLCSQLVDRLGRSLPPGPREWPVIGALPWVLTYRHRMLDGLLRALESQGGLHSAPRTLSARWLGEPRWWFTADPAVVEHVLRTNFGGYVKGAPVASRLGALLGRGIFTQDGEAWRAQRKAASWMFSHREMTDTVMAAIVSHGPGLTARLDAAAASGAAVDLHALFHAFTLDSIGLIAFGAELGALEDPALPFARAFDAAQALVDKRFVTPGWRLWEALDGSGARLAAAAAVVQSHAQGLIDARRAAGDAAARRDVLSRLMCETDEAGGAAHSDAALRDAVTNFMVAGRDTTAQALSWGVLLLATHPEAERQVAAEAAALWGGAPEAGGGRVPFDAITARLPFTTACVLETLRLYPSVPKDVKTAVRDDTLPCGARLRAGEMLLWSPFAMGRSRALWGADAADFRPARFLTPEGALARPSPFKFTAFNAGPRTCLGSQMALAEAAYVLALLLQRYTLRLAPDLAARVHAWGAAAAAGGAAAAAAGVTPVPYMESLTLPMAQPLMCLVTRRVNK